ncbi:MAG: OmpA family protein [Chthonomonadaceae bacterium]|nr:OmpA family protein [Chthonomonadaceae bacterium]
MQEGTPIIIKKKKGHGHGHHGGAWKVAYADFVTAMMAFFMVMWIMGMDQPTREVIAGYFKDPIGWEKNTPKHKVNLIKDSGAVSTSPTRGNPKEKKEIEQVRQLEETVTKAIEQKPELKKLKSQHGIEIRRTPEGLQIELVENETNSELFFKLGSAEVRSQARAVLARLAPILRSTGRKMIVDGHTDARPLNRVGYDNFDLSHDRANMVRKILVNGGCRASQFLAVRGFAANQPRKATDPYHFSNRRVTILIPYVFPAAKIEGLPGDVARESIEGVFKMPDTSVDLTQKER